MSDAFDRKTVKSIIDRAMDKIESQLDSCKESTKSIPFGGRQPSRREFMELWRRKTQEYPPQPYILPDGRTVVESAWILNLMLLCENGKESLGQFRRIVKDEADASI